ncbi:MAG TPA: site-specific integrase [candidate division Zixibacteria bacterium]|nr:site-specific integrase [candidate division Zixibacteria bacterium]
MEEGRERRKKIEGFGSIFRKRFKRRREDGTEYLYENPVWHIAYYHRGEELRESCHSTEERDAIRLLKKRVQDLGRGVVGTREERVTFERLAEDLKNDYLVNRKRSLRSVELSLSHLANFFGGDRAVHITTDRIRAYIAQRQSQGAANASINRELAALKRAFTLAQQAGRLSSRPYIPTLEENNARQGFLDHGSFLRLKQHLPESLRDPVAFLYHSGWRVSEMRQLEWRDVDLPGGVIRLRPETSKNKEARLLPIAGPLVEIIERAHRARRLDCPFVFHVGGKPIGDFRKAWRSACVAAGLGGLIVHDLRRSAVRNMIRAGIAEKVAMSLSGHKTRSVFDRYHIVSEDDLAQASERLFEYLAEQSQEPKVARLAGVRG